MSDRMATRTPARPGATVELVAFLTAFIACTYGFGLYLFPALVPEIRQDIAFGNVALGILSGGAQAGFLAAAALGGLMTVRLGATRLVFGTLAVCGASLLALSTASGPATLAVPLVVLGACAAAVWVPMVGVVQAAIPERHRGKALGLISSGTSFGVAVNSFLVAHVAAFDGWRGLWLACGAAVLVLAAVAFARIGRRLLEADAAVASGDVSSTTPRGEPERAPRLVGTLLALMFLSGVACMPFQTFLSAYLVDELRASSGTAAMAWRTIGIVGVFGGLAFGALADRTSIRKALALAYGAVAAASAACSRSRSRRSGRRFRRLFSTAPRSTRSSGCCRPTSAGCCRGRAPPTPSPTATSRSARARSPAT
jgi:predicted MFS family arabinose efflux permease